MRIATGACIMSNPLTSRTFLLVNLSFHPIFLWSPLTSSITETHCWIGQDEYRYQDCCLLFLVENLEAVGNSVGVNLMSRLPKNYEQVMLLGNRFVL